MTILTSPEWSTLTYNEWLVRLFTQVCWDEYDYGEVK